MDPGLRKLVIVCALLFLTFILYLRASHCRNVADRAVLSTCLGPPLRRLLRQAAASLFSGAKDHARASRASFRDRSRGAGAEEFELLARDDFGDDAYG